MTVEDIMRTGFLMAASTIEKDVRLTDITENELSGLFTAQLKALADAGYAVVPVEPTDSAIERAARALFKYEPGPYGDCIEEAIEQPYGWRDQVEAVQIVLKEIREHKV